MYHLRIELNNILENVSNNVIAKLYELALTNLDNTSNLQGQLHTTATYLEFINGIRNKYPELYITSDKYYVKFNDPVFLRVCAQRYGDGVGMTMEDFLAVTDNSPLWAFNNNSEITDMTEFKYFTNIPGHLNAGDNGYNDAYLLLNLSNLQKLELPNQIVKLGSVTVGTSGYKGIFDGTDALTYCKFPNNMEYLAISVGGPKIMDLLNTKLTGLYARHTNSCTEEIYLPGTFVNVEVRLFTNFTGLKKAVVAEGSSPLLVRSKSGYSIMFGANRGATLDLPSNTTLIHRSIFLGNNSGERFILRAVNPPTEVAGDGTNTETTEPMVNSSQVDLYVPDESISLYQSNTIYSSFKHIYGLSQLPSDYSVTPLYS